MLPDTKTGTDLSSFETSPSCAPVAKPAELCNKTDLADVLASFAAQTGDEVSPELSDVALEIVLNQIVEHACLNTGATGAAIILPMQEEMVCRVSCGSTAPEVGDRFDVSSGPFGECIKSQSTQRCDDALADSQVNIDALQRWGARSLILMPLVLEAECTGLFGLFSSHPSAFGKSIEQTMEVLARRALSNLQRAAAVSEGASKPAAARLSDPIRHFDVVTMALALVVIGCALLLGTLAGRRFASHKTTVHMYPQASPPSAVVEQTGARMSLPGTGERANVLVPQPAPIKPATVKPVPPGGLVVFANGKEVFRMPPTHTQADSPTRPEELPSQR